MRLTQLVYFQRVSEAGSYSGAASRIGIAQPALSQQILALEAELGTALFVRHAHGVTLTESGILFLEHASRIIRQVELAKSAVMDASRQPRGEVGLGLAPSIAVTLLVPILEALWAEAPLVHLRIVEAHSDYLAGLIRGGTLDIAALFDLPNAQGLELETLFIEDLYLVSPPGHESSCHQEVPFSELGTLPLILPTRVQGLRMAVERAAFASRTALVVRAEVDAVSNIIAAVRAGLGHSVLSRVSVIHDPIQPGLPARRIIAPEIRRSAQLATGTNQMQSGAVRVVKEVVRRLIQTRIASGAWHVSSIKAASDL